MRELLVATRNEGKLPGILVGLKDIPFKVVTLNNIDIPRDYIVEEPGSTYEAHAAIKAILYGKKSGLLTLADDSGLEIDALDGWPGVHSATHMQGSDVERLNGLLARMNDVPEEKRGAQYRSIVALFDPLTEKLRFEEGVCRGSIMSAPKGNEGFGYDPIFYSDDLQAGFGESPLEERAKISHRARALVKAREILLKEFV